MPWRCPDCGIYKAGLHSHSATHECDQERFIKYQTSIFPVALKNFLATPRGRFEIYYAKRLIRQGSAQPDNGQG